MECTCLFVTHLQTLLQLPQNLHTCPLLLLLLLLCASVCMCVCVHVRECVHLCVSCYFLTELNTTVLRCHMHTAKLPASTPWASIQHKQSMTVVCSKIHSINSSTTSWYQGKCWFILCFLVYSKLGFNLFKSGTCWLKAGASLVS